MGTRAGLAIAIAVSLLANCGDRESAAGADHGSGITGTVTLGPRCPVQRQDQPCPDQPAGGARVTVAEHQTGGGYGAGAVVARTTTAEDGTYRVDVAPGRYVVTSDAGMSCELVDAHVVDGAYADVDLACDTGIR